MADDHGWHLPSGWMGRAHMHLCERCQPSPHTPDEAPTKPQTPDAHRKYSSGSMQAVRPGGLASRVDAILEEGKEPKP
jgi:hypothetical protein